MLLIKKIFNKFNFFLLFFLVLLPQALWAHGVTGPETEENCMMHSIFGWRGGLFTGSWILMIVFWVLIVWIVVWLAKNLIGKNNGQENGEKSRALDILAERYARGEIKKEEFEAKKKNIINN